MPFQLAIETIWDHLRWLSRYQSDPRVRQHMNAVEAVLYKAKRLPMAEEVEVAVRRRLAARERDASRASTAVAVVVQTGIPIVAGRKLASSFIRWRC